MNILIEKNVPIPADNGWKAKLEALEIGDSLPLPREKRAYIASLISSDFHALTDKRFHVSVKEQPKGKARVWRIEDNIDNHMPAA